MSEKDQSDDPAWLLAYGAPEELPVSQEVEHGPALNRYQQFMIGSRDAVDSWEAWDRANYTDLFTGRRARRYRPGSNLDPGDEPYDMGPVDEDRYNHY
jgi:hypothetical protein